MAVRAWAANSGVPAKTTRMGLGKQMKWGYANEVPRSDAWTQVHSGRYTGLLGKFGTDARLFQA